MKYNLLINIVNTSCSIFIHTSQSTHNNGYESPPLKKLRHREWPYLPEVIDRIKNTIQLSSTRSVSSLCTIYTSLRKLLLQGVVQNKQTECLPGRNPLDTLSLQLLFIWLIWKIKSTFNIYKSPAFDLYFTHPDCIGSVSVFHWTFTTAQTFITSTICY